MLPIPLLLDLGALVVVGATPFRLVSIAGTNAKAVKGLPGQVVGWSAANLSGTWRFLKLFDVAGTPAVGTDAPEFTIGLPPMTEVSLALSGGIAFSAGIALAMTAGPEDTDASPVGAGEIVLSLFFE